MVFLCFYLYAMNKVLEINGLSKRYNKLLAVNQLSFSVEKGNVYGLLGPNGSGKSTTLGIILNVVNKTSGDWKWFGEDPSKDSLKRIGAIIERPNFYPYLTAEQNLKIVAKIKEVSFDKINEKLKIVGLIDRKQDKFSTYSLGMKQRLAIASALLNDPEVLILDEPTNGLDPQGIIQIREIIQQIAQKGTTIILASHLLDEVEKICSHVVILERGKMIYSGGVSEITSSFGYLEINANETNTLKNALESINSIDKVVAETKFFKAFLNSDVSAEEINKTMMEKGIVLNHLVKKKDSLEQQFLELTKKNYAQ